MTIKEAYDKGFRDRTRINLIVNNFIEPRRIEEELLDLPSFTGYDPPKEDADNNNLKFLCARCGIGFYLPSGKCDHCNYDQPKEDGDEPQEK